MSKGILVKYKIRKRERVSLTYNDYGPSRMEVREYEVSYEEWYEVLKAESRAKEFGRTTNVWTVPV